MTSDTSTELSEPVRRYVEQNLPVLESDTRRYVISYLGENEEAGVNELVDELSSDLDMDETVLEIQLYHNDLPKLNEDGLVVYHSAAEYVELSDDGREVREWMEEFDLI